jgi:hypothetical protein
MTITRQYVFAAVVAVAAACASATASLASTNTSVPAKPDHVMTDPCARVMNWPHRALVTFSATPPSERGLQCPIQEDFGPPAND